MDSVMSAQLVDKMGFLRPLKPVFTRIEGRAIRSASGVVAMCDEIADHARSINPAAPVACLEDIDLHNADGNGNEDLRTMLGISGPLLLYVGNLETYQGIDLLLDAMGELKDRYPSAGLVVIGGSDEHISRYQALASRQGVAEQVFFVGRRDVTLLGYFLRQADISFLRASRGPTPP
jgi:glycosyltransferase involved in cell wall biosynthesis